MADTLDALASHLGRLQGTPAKIVVWAHNSHLGDARATETSARGELTLASSSASGTPASPLVGFTTYTGTVTAASRLRGRARSGSASARGQHRGVSLHEVGGKSCSASASRRGPPMRCARARLQRAIGVIYRPETERRSHYFRARLADQFDAVIHLDETRAVEPLERTAGGRKAKCRRPIRSRYDASLREAALSEARKL